MRESEGQGRAWGHVSYSHVLTLLSPAEGVWAAASARGSQVSDLFLRTQAAAGMEHERGQRPVCTLTQTWEAGSHTLWGLPHPPHLGPGGRGLPESWLSPALQPEDHAQGAFSIEDTYLTQYDTRAHDACGVGQPSLQTRAQSLTLLWGKAAAAQSSEPEAGLRVGERVRRRQGWDVVQPCLIQPPVNSKGPEHRVLLLLL